jgi:pimeloyl-ACP methyl ester carboxylesterase
MHFRRFVAPLATFAFASLAAVTATGCSSSATDGETNGNDALSEGADHVAAGCSDSIADVYVAPSNLSAFTPDSRGEIVRCAYDRTLTAADVDKTARSEGYTGPTLTSGARVYRIAYRTERVVSTSAASSATPLAGITSAVVLLPDHPVAAKHPLVVAGHGSVGIADTCAPSRGDLMTTGNFLDDARSLVLPLAGYGYTVVMPDYAGFGYGGTTGWSLSEDEAHSLLDSTRAMNKLLAPGSLSGEVAIVGHSQGGHAVISAQSYAASYGLAGHLAGVVAEAPLWIPARSWGAALTDVLGLRPSVSAGALAYAIQYFYTHGEIYDGAGHGTDMFQSGVQQEIRDALTTTCLDTLGDKLATFGQHPSDLFSSGFALSVSTCADIGLCLGSDASAWKQRFKDDRPSIDPNGAPLVVINGGQDGTVTPSLAACGIEKIDEDMSRGGSTAVDFCFDQDAIHGSDVGAGEHPELGITRRNADWINHWVAARTLGAKEPGTCTAWTGKAADGSSISCPSLPPNNDF